MGIYMKKIATSGQISIFDLFHTYGQTNLGQNTSEDDNADISNIVVWKYSVYDLSCYENDVLQRGLEKTWEGITSYVLNYDVTNQFLELNNLTELYEIGLALHDKQRKKNSGQYYTPNDVANVMADWFDRQKGSNICDVGCGTGKLILTYLDLIGKNAATELLREGRIYLYDSDKTALNICKTILLLKYGKDLEPCIHAIHCDFLSKEINLPKDCKVICNPPYASVKSIKPAWEKTDVATSTKELYSMFMEKIIKQSESAVIITPYSFIGGPKFYPLRELMNNYNGFIVSFDNVPCNIFYGRKHGIFNTNKANSVRAAITVVENRDGLNGFRTTPLIRFKKTERKKLLTNEVLESFINDKYQIVSEDAPMYLKCAKQLNIIWDAWQTYSDKRLGDYVTEAGKYVLSMPNTCRYFTVASAGKMKRTGQIVLNFDDENVFYYAYCLINSSFAYWFWRLFDGGITYTKGLLLNLPMFYDKLSDGDKQFFHNQAEEMIRSADKYVVTKNNVGIQENIKFPRAVRDKINRKILDILHLQVDEKIFDMIHSNMALEISI